MGREGWTHAYKMPDKEREGVVSTSQIKHPHSFSLLIETGFAYGNPDLTNSVWDFLLANTLGN